MASVLDGVNQRTKLVGYNRLELLLFRLIGKQRFGINVFKVREVIQCPVLTRLPGSHPVVRGVANIRGRTIPVVDLGVAVGKPPLTDIHTCYVIITEYNRVTQGFLVREVDRIVNMNWEEIHPPPKGSGRGTSYLTAVTQVDNELVEIIDVEKVLAEVTHPNEEVSPAIAEEGAKTVKVACEILVVDDSSVARKQIQRTLEQVGVTPIMACNGREALTILQEMTVGGHQAKERLAIVISDIEMPEMDGYTLTTEIRRDPTLQDLYVVLHTSLSGVFNQSMVKKVGADHFIAKFSPDELARVVLDRIKG